MHNLPNHGHQLLGTPGSPAAYAKHRSAAANYDASPVANRFGSPEVKTVCPQPQRPQTSLLPFWPDPSSPSSPSPFEDGMAPKAQPSSWGESRPLSSVSTSAGPTPGVDENWHYANRHADTGMYNLQNSPAYQQAMQHQQVHGHLRGHEQMRPLSALSASTRATPSPEEMNLQWQQGCSPEHGNRAGRPWAGDSRQLAQPGAQGPGRGDGQPPQDRKVFVGGVPQDMNQDDLYGVFSEYSGVKKAWLQKCKPPANTTPTPPPQNHRGFGFVIFHDADAVDKLLDPNHQDVKWKDGDMSRYISLANGKKIEVKRAISSNKMPDGRQQTQQAALDQSPQSGKGWAQPPQQSSGRSTPFSPPPMAHPMSPLPPRHGGCPVVMPPGNFVPGQRPGGLAMGPGRPGPVLASTQPPLPMPQWPPQPLATSWHGSAPLVPHAPVEAYPPMVPPMPGCGTGMVAMPMPGAGMAAAALPMQQQPMMYVMPGTMQQPMPMGMPNGMATGMQQGMHQGMPNGLHWIAPECRTDSTAMHQFPQVGEMELRAASPTIYED